ncbi:MAG: hypothetical protein H6741_08570 [Alphaproteobacteria bacterium]|nr:hypothetical protein [Alphaproteobacteria bacterium]MCB9792771.1 hypothetical protein [Alphaproteobacteria bacterium]
MKLWARWIQAVTAKEEASTLAMLRIALGLCALGTVLTVVSHGLVEAIWLPAELGGYRDRMHPGFFFEHVPLNTGTLWATLAASLLSSALLAAGLGGRVMAFITLQTTMAVTDINGHTGGSYDELLTCGLWLLVLADSTRTLSLDCRLRTGRWTDDTPVYAFPRWLMLYQLLLAYGSTGSQKVSAYWTPVGGYSALYYILQQPSWHRFDMSWLAPLYPLTQLATLTTWLFEITAPLMLLVMWYRATPERPGRLRRWSNRLRLRRLFMAFGVSLHLGVFALMEVGPFSWITLSFYLAFIDPEEWRAAWRWLQARRGRAPEASPRPADALS